MDYKRGLKSVAAIFVGLLVGGTGISLIETLGHRLSPLPPGTDVSTPEKVAALMQQLPLSAFLVILAAWFVGTFLGAGIAVRIGGRPVLLHGGLVTLFFFSGGVFNVSQIPHPTWFVVLGLLSFFPAGFLGSQLGGAGDAAA